MCECLPTHPEQESFIFLSVLVCTWVWVCVHLKLNSFSYFLYFLWNLNKTSPGWKRVTLQSTSATELCLKISLGLASTGPLPSLQLSIRFRFKSQQPMDNYPLVISSSHGPLLEDINGVYRSAPFVTTVTTVRFCSFLFFPQSNEWFTCQDYATYSRWL